MGLTRFFTSELWNKKVDISLKEKCTDTIEGEMVLSRDKIPNRFSNPKWSALNIHMHSSNTKCT